MRRPGRRTDGRATWFAANAVIERGDLALASELLPTTFGDPWAEAAVLSSRAKLAHATGDLLGAAAAAREVAQAPAAPAVGDETDRVSARLVAALGREPFDALVTDGRSPGPGEAGAQI
ncbi:hypothetical protein [Micromonospora sp. NPDC050200]|uniref:hypothetical protein n=1 Tax=Micromonospora sp. NPDC050200 TaxID=3155664 RepID=UPI0033DE916E